MPAIGFAILTHNRPQQLQRLVRTLDAMFDRPPVAVHHDFGQLAIDTGAFPPFVQFVRPHFHTGWGAPALNDAALGAISVLYRDGVGPDWVVLLSGADYPIQPAERILGDLNGGGFDLYLKHHLVCPREPDYYNREMAKRYMRWIQRVWWIDRHLKLRSKTKGVPVWASKLLLPFGRNFRCYAGSQWFTANRKATLRLLELHQDNPIRRHYWKVPVPDESYVHCLWVNQKDLRIANDNKRYTDHPIELPHPRTLHAGDFETLVNSSAHFARKFEPDDPVLDQLDEWVGIGAGSAGERAGVPAEP